MKSTLKIRNFKLYAGSKTVVYPKPPNTRGGGRIYRSTSEVTLSFWIHGYDGEKKINYKKNFTIDVKNEILKAINRKNLTEKVKKAITVTKPNYLIVEVDHQNKTAEINSIFMSFWAMKIAAALSDQGR